MSVDDVVKILNSVAWPSATVLGVLIFRKPISDLLGRTTSVTKDGVKAEPPVVPASQELQKPIESQNIETVFDWKVMTLAEGLITKDLQERNISYEGEAAKVLIKQLASTQIQLGYERIHRRIYGTQFDLLKRLNERRTAGMDKEWVEKYFVALQKDEEFFEEWNVNDYMAFLLSEHLVFEGDTDYFITDLGVEFLVYVSRIGLGDPRVF